MIIGCLKQYKTYTNISFQHKEIKLTFFQNIFDDVYVSVSKARLHPGSTQRGSKLIIDDIDDDDDGDDNPDDNCCGNDDDVNNHDDDHNGDDHVDYDDDDGGCSSTSGFH